MQQLTVKESETPLNIAGGGRVEGAKTSMSFLVSAIALPHSCSREAGCLISLLAAILSITLLVTSSFLSSWRRKRFAKEHNCEESSRLTQWDPILGFDTLLQSYRSIKSGEYLSTSHKRFLKHGDTFRFNMLGTRVVNTIEPENVKTVLSTKFDDFVLGSRREAAFTPLIGHGIFTADGAAWKQSRRLIRPNFANDKAATLVMLEKHVSNLIDNIPSDGRLIDLGAFFHRFTVDTATEFLFGESLYTLSLHGEGRSEDKQEFAGAFRRGQRAIADNFALGMFARLVPGHQFRRDRDCVRDFIDRFVERALAPASDCKDTLGESSDHAEKPLKYTFLDELAKYERDPEVLRGELLHLLVAGRDTTASLLSNLWFMLARTPRVCTKLREEIALLEGRQPSLEELNDMLYLKHCVSECE